MNNIYTPEKRKITDIEIDNTSTVISDIPAFENKVMAIQFLID